MPDEQAMFDWEFVYTKIFEVPRLTEGKYGSSLIREDADNHKNQRTSLAVIMAETDIGETRTSVNSRKMVYESKDQQNEAFPYIKQNSIAEIVSTMESFRLLS